MTREEKSLVEQLVTKCNDIRSEYGNDTPEFIRKITEITESEKKFRKFFQDMIRESDRKRRYRAEQIARDERIEKYRQEEYHRVLTNLVQSELQVGDCVECEYHGYGNDRYNGIGKVTKVTKAYATIEFGTGNNERIVRVSRFGDRHWSNSDGMSLYEEYGSGSRYSRTYTNVRRKLNTKLTVEDASDYHRERANRNVYK